MIHASSIRLERPNKFIYKKRNFKRRKRRLHFGGRERVESRGVQIRENGGEKGIAREQCSWEGRERGEKKREKKGSLKLKFIFRVRVTQRLQRSTFRT